MKRDSSSNLNVPLIEENMLTDDPFYGFRDELQTRINSAFSRFENWKVLLNDTNTAENLAFKEENSKLKAEVSQLLTNVQELEEVIYRIETNRDDFNHISDKELAARQVSVKEIKQRVNTMKFALASQRTQNKIKSDLAALQSKQKQSTNGRVYQNSDTSINGEYQFLQAALRLNQEGFIRSQQQRQEFIRQEQDDHLQDLHDSAERLNVMAGTIGEEIDDQGRMIEELADDVEHTESRMEHALSRMDKLLKSNNRCQTWTILMLILIAVIMFILVANSF